MYLAMIAGLCTSIYSTYILFLTEMQKRQITEKEFAPYDIRKHKFFRVSKTFDT